MTLIFLEVLKKMTFVLPRIENQVQLTSTSCWVTQGWQYPTEQFAGGWWQLVCEQDFPGKKTISERCSASETSVVGKTACQLDQWTVEEGPVERWDQNINFWQWWCALCRRPGEDCLPECTTATMKHPLSITAWGCMSRDHVGRRQVLDGIVNADKYINDVLQTKLLLSARDIFGDWASFSRMVLYDISLQQRNVFSGGSRIL